MKQTNYVQGYLRSNSEYEILLPIGSKHDWFFTGSVVTIADECQHTIEAEVLWCQPHIDNKQHLVRVKKLFGQKEWHW